MEDLTTLQRDMLYVIANREGLIGWRSEMKADSETEIDHGRLTHATNLGPCDYFTHLPAPAGRRCRL